MLLITGLAAVESELVGAIGATHGVLVSCERGVQKLGCDFLARGRYDFLPATKTDGRQTTTTYEPYAIVRKCKFEAFLNKALYNFPNV